MVKLKVNYIENCFYSNKLIELLDRNKIKYEKNLVPTELKKKYKNDLIQTFPQVYLIDKKKSYLIGGYTKFQELFNNKNDTNKFNSILNIPYKLKIRLLILINSSK